MMMNKDACVYILTNKNHSVIYVGVTSDLGKRIIQHKTGFFKNAFTSRYNVTELVYFEEFERLDDAFKREKQLKAGSREKKINSISGFNPKWEDLCKKRP
jgi:putative endonuclease